MDTSLPMLAKRLGEGEAFEALSRVQTIGLGGCMFETEEALGYRTLMQLLISLGDRVVAADGRVVYELPAGEGKVQVGVEFIRLSEDDRQAISTLFTRTVVDRLN